MAIGAIIALVIVIVLAAAVAGTLLRRRALKKRFGPEYDRLAERVGERRALSELTDRQRRMGQLDIRPLSAERRAAYEGQWSTLPGQFIDSPARAVEAAAALVSAVAADRGYHVADQERLIGDLSVYHADRMEAYRKARQVTGQPPGTTTEDLRQAMLAYRALLGELFESPDGASQPADADAAGADAAGTETTAAGPGVATVSEPLGADDSLDDRPARAARAATEE